MIFVGQASASNVMPCPSEANGRLSSIQSLMMNPSMSAMADMKDTSSSATKDCCAEDNDCSMTGCIALALPNLLNSLELTFTIQNVKSSIKTTILQSSTSLYRPPILS